MRKWPTSLTLCFITFLFVITGCQDNARTLSEQIPDTLVVATNVGYPPFIIKDMHGKLAGFDYDLMQEVGRRLGKKIRFIDMSFDALLIALHRGRVDMVIGGVTITPTRRKHITFIPYYGNDSPTVSLLYKNTIFSQVTTLDDLAHLPRIKGRKPIISTQAGAAFEALLTPYTNITVKTLSDIADLAFDVYYGKSDACLLDEKSVAVITGKKESLAAQTIMLSEQQRTSGFGIGIAQRNTTLYRKVAALIAQLKEEQFIEQLEQKWAVNTQGHDYD